MEDDPIAVSFQVNGRQQVKAVRADTTLLDVLRDELALTGAKRGCNSGLCGACNVLLDGHTVRSCLTLCVTADGSSVQSIEGLAVRGSPSVVQQAFLDTGAIQCGFCMSGMIVSATELLTRNPQPTRDEIRHGLAGNLCRCSGYVKVIDAVELAASRISGKAQQQGGHL